MDFWLRGEGDYLAERAFFYGLENGESRRLKRVTTQFGFPLYDENKAESLTPGCLVLNSLSQVLMINHVHIFGREGVNEVGG